MPYKGGSLTVTLPVISRKLRIQVLKIGKLELTIYADRLKVPPGKPITVYGFLKIDDHPLEGELIEIYQEEEKIGETKTGDKGEYRLEIRLPSTPGTYTFHAEARVNEKKIEELGYVLE